MKTSIALCTYNGEKYLPQLLDSIHRQSVTPNEIIVCDDGSTDQTLEVLKEFSSKTEIEYRLYINAEQLGSTKNFEQAIDKCSGDLIFFCDQDDVWHKEKLEKVIFEFQENKNVGAVFTDAHVVNEELKSLGYSLWDSVGFNPKNFKDKLVEPIYLLKHNAVTGATMAFRKEFKTSIIPIPSSWVHDEWIALLVSVLSKLIFLDEKLISYRQHGANQIGAQKKSLKERVNPTKQVSQDFYLEKYLVLKEKLLDLKGNYNKQLLLEVNNKIEHLEKRINIPASVPRRMFLVLSELLSLRYHKYSNGFYSAAKDLLRR